MAKSEAPRVLREYWEQPPERLAQDNITVTSSDVLEDPRLEKHLHETVPASLVQPHRLRWAQAAFPDQEERRQRDERSLLRHEERKSEKSLGALGRRELCAEYVLARQDGEEGRAAVLLEEIMRRVEMWGNQYLAKKGLL